MITLAQQYLKSPGQYYSLDIITIRSNVFQNLYEFLEKQVLQKNFLSPASAGMTKKKEALKILMHLKKSKVLAKLRLKNSLNILI